MASSEPPKSGPPRTTRWWRRPVDRAGASGIVRLKTGFFPTGPMPYPRRKLPRPPLAVNLGLLAFGILLAAGAVVHRRALDRRFSELLRANASVPFEIKRIRAELADLEVDERTLSRQLDARLKYVESAKRADFYILLDGRHGRFTFRYADRILRDAPAQVGPPLTIEGPRGKRWTFAPMSGAFSVREKVENGSWEVPEWVFRMNGQPVPKPLPRVPNGLGRYVLVLSNGYAIHSPPAPESPLHGPKPGSFLVPEVDLAAIWRRVGPETRVYAF